MKQINIPCDWFKRICHKTEGHQEKVDILAIAILAEIVGSKDLFVDGQLQKSPNELASLFNVSSRMVRRSMQTLEKMGLIKIHLHSYKTSEGISIPNIMHISIDHEKIQELSQ